MNKRERLTIHMARHLSSQALTKILLPATRLPVQEVFLERLREEARCRHWKIFSLLCLEGVVWAEGWEGWAVRLLAGTTLRHPFRYRSWKAPRVRRKR